MKHHAIVATLGLTALAATGCQNQMHEENLALHRQNKELQARTAELESQLSTRPDASQLDVVQQQLAERDAKIAQLQDQLRQPPPGQPAEKELSGIEVTRDVKNKTLTVNLPGDVLFESGKADLKGSAKATLAKVANAVKKEYSGKTVYVDGYTDSDPIARTKGKWEDNLDLSAARSRAVAKFLVEQGLSGKLVHERAMSDTSPKRSKSSSRRVEVVVQTG